MWQFYLSFYFVLDFTNAFSCSAFHIQSASFFKVVLNGKLMPAKLGMNLLIWLTALRNERGYFKFVGPSLSLISWALAFIGDIPVFVNLNPNHSMLSCAIIHFSAFKCKSASSRTFITSLTLFRCSCLLPFVTINISSIYTNTLFTFAKVMSFNFWFSVGITVRP